MEGEIPRLFNIGGTSQFYVLDADGKIVGKAGSAKELDKLIVQTLGG